MSSQNTQLYNRKPGEVVLAMALAAAVCNLDGVTAQWCSLAERMSWAAFEVLRFVLLTGCSQSGSRLLEVILQLGPWFWCVSHWIAGRA
jgi:hypothetical protein